MLQIYVHWGGGYVAQWEDIGVTVYHIVYIDNCAGNVDNLYMSEDGVFYNEKHKLIAENEEEFFDYLTTVEYDFHPVISERTYDMLRFFGWYEGRRVDTTDFECEMRQRSIVLTQKQLDFLSEFSGLYFSFKDVYYDWWFYTLDEIFQDNSPQLRTGYKEAMHYQGETVALNALVCGDRIDTMCPLYVDSEGRILEGPFPYGRNTIESINHLANNVNEDVEWRRIKK